MKMNFKNIDLVAKVFKSLDLMGVSDIVICAGARNAPLVAALEQTKFSVESYFEERSAGFYALGKIKSSQKPVAIITTSGTAVAELLPAVIEAYYQSLPLIIVSADRPKSYRGSGSPQSIEQVGIFSSYVQSCIDWDVQNSDIEIMFSNYQPLHLNICFDEPLIDGDLQHVAAVDLKIIKNNKSAIPTIKNSLKTTICNPIVIISELQFSDRELVTKFLIKNRIVHVAESLSGLKNFPELLPYQIQCADFFVKDIFRNFKADSILRIGGIPTLRFWRDLETEYQDIPVYSFSDARFSGLSRSSHTHPLKDIETIQIETNKPIDLAADRELHAARIRLLSDYKKSEQSMFAGLSNLISSDPVYIGNSLPIRMWDDFSRQSQKSQSIAANRGANGIDGQISTYIGWAQSKIKSWCVVGDLTALYDLAALGLALDSKNKYRIVVINNYGGQIFGRIFRNKKYLNAQNVDFKSWAKLWHWDYIQINDVSEFSKLDDDLGARVIIEVKPNSEETEIFWKQWDQFCKK